jgi:hypothetical protein
VAVFVGDRGERTLGEVREHIDLKRDDGPRARSQPIRYAATVTVR